MNALWRATLGGLAVLNATAAPAAGITVTVNETAQYETVEAIGIMDRTAPWSYRSGPFYVPVNLDSPHYFDTLIQDGGFTALRAFDGITEYQAQQGNFAVAGRPRTELAYHAKFMQAAARAGEPFRIMQCVLSPPPWMKANNSCCVIGDNDPNNYLLPSHYGDFAEHCIRYLQAARDSFGVEVYALSLQNEPLFNEPYASSNYSLGPGCGWNGVCYNNMFKEVAPRIRTALPDLKFYASEDLNRTTIESALRADPVSNPLIHAWATHNDFVGSFAYVKDRPIWNTEPHTNAEDVMNCAQMLMSNLAAGASVWLEWSIGSQSCATSPTNSMACFKTGTYRAVKMFARYIRPGARRIESSGGTGGSYGVIAYYHPENSCLTIVLINATGTAVPATLNISGEYRPAQLQVFQASQTQEVTEVGTVAIDGTVTLPPQSVTTLVAGKYRATATSVGPGARITSTASPKSTRAPAIRTYSLDGRLVGAGSVGAAMRAGVCLIHSGSTARTVINVR